jgi:hypothetical protein
MQTVAILETPIKSDIQTKLQELMQHQLKKGYPPGAQIALAYISSIFLTFVKSPLLSFQPLARN